MIKSLFRKLFSRRPSAPEFRLPEINDTPPPALDEFTRRTIRAWLADPTTKLVMSLVEAQHPGRNVPTMLPRSEADKDAAVCYLNRIRGWELYRNQVLTILRVPEAGGDVHETYQTQE